MGDLHGVGRAPSVSRWRAAATAAGLSVLFMVVYGGANWLASQQEGLGALAFDWERSIPFVPLFIIPYMSIDLFFVGAPFLCNSKDELQVFSRRIAFSILLAGAFFVLLPYRFAFPRPVPEGWTKPIFVFLHSFDQPQNLFPSLHITLRTLLAGIYVRHNRGLLRWAVRIWFVLIGLSTVLTYQHHVMDVVGGFILAAYAIYLIPGGLPRQATTNPRVGSYYGLGALLLLGLAVACWPWGALLLWPASALGLIAAAYVGWIPNVYRKNEGRIPIVARILLAPVRFGQYLSLLYYAPKTRPWDEIAPGVWLGRVLRDDEAAEAVDQGVTAVLDVTGEFNAPLPFLAVRYRNIPVLDLTAPTIEQMAEAAQFIAEERRRGIVYVHCKIGYSRSAAMLGAHLITSEPDQSVDAVLDRMQNARPSLIVRLEARAALHALEALAAAKGPHEQLQAIRGP